MARRPPTGAFFAFFAFFATGVREMSVLKLPRKKLAEVKARRNGLHKALAVPIQTREESEESEERSHPTPCPDSAQSLTGARRDDFPYRLVTAPAGLSTVA